MRIGVHCSIRGSILNSIKEARDLNCETFQMFSRSPRNWKRKKMKKSEIKEFIAQKEKFDLKPLALHLPYLLNLASSKRSLRKKSIRILKEDLKLSEKLKADYLIIHPGFYPQGKDALYGSMLVAEAVSTVLQSIKNNITLLVENTSGGGRKIGSTFEELRIIINEVKERIGICLDLAHLYASGYDVSTADKLDKVLALFDELIGIKYIKLIHLNDSFYWLGSKKDRHQHIGKGYISLDCFRRILNHEEFRGIPGIIETPKDSDDADIKNLRTLFSLRGSANEAV